MSLSSSLPEGFERRTATGRLEPARTSGECRSHAPGRDMAARSMPERGRIWPRSDHPHPSIHQERGCAGLEPHRADAQINVVRPQRPPGRLSRTWHGIRRGHPTRPVMAAATGSALTPEQLEISPRSCHRGRTRPSGHPAISGGIRSQRCGRSATSFSGSPEARSKAPHGVRVASGAEVSERISAYPAIRLARFSSNP